MRAHLRRLVDIIAIAVAVGLVPTDAQGQEISRIAGTWIFDLSESTCFVGSCPLRTIVFQDRGEGEVRAEFRAGAGSRGSYTATHDGENYRVSGGFLLQFLRGGFRQPEPSSRSAPGGLYTIAFTPVDAFTSDWVLRNDGAVSTTGTSTVSRDGQTYTQIVYPGGIVQVFHRRPQ